jgi:hypothetical protein
LINFVAITKNRWAVFAARRFGNEGEDLLKAFDLDPGLHLMFFESCRKLLAFGGFGHSRDGHEYLFLREIEVTSDRHETDRPDSWVSLVSLPWGLLEDGGDVN